MTKLPSSYQYEESTYLITSVFVRLIENIFFLKYRTVGLRERFNRMGLNDQEIVAISGAHSIGR